MGSLPTYLQGHKERDMTFANIIKLCISYIIVIIANWELVHDQTAAMTNRKQFFKLKCIVYSAFWKANILKVELSIIKMGELLRKFWSSRSCFLILPPGALTPQGSEGTMKPEVRKHWCTLQWCASRCWFIAHENWTSCMLIFYAIHYHHIFVGGYQPNHLHSLGYETPSNH